MELADEPLRPAQVDWRYPLQLFSGLIAGDGVVLVETWQPGDGTHDYCGLDVGGDEVAHGEFHGAWIEWLA